MSSTFPCHSHVPDPRRVCLGGSNGTDTRLTRSFSSLPFTQPLAMPARIPPDTDPSRIATVCAFHLVLSTLHYGKNRARDGICIEEQLWADLPGQSYMQGILQRGQDRAISLLSLSSLFFKSLLIPCTNKTATLGYASATPSPELGVEALQNNDITLRDKNERPRSENGEMVRKLKVAGASREAFHSQFSSLKEANANQQDEIGTLWKVLVEVKDLHDRFVTDSDA